MTTTSPPRSRTICAADAPMPVAPPTTSARLPSYRNDSMPTMLLGVSRLATDVSGLSVSRGDRLCTLQEQPRRHRVERQAHVHRRLPGQGPRVRPFEQDAELVAGEDEEPRHVVDRSAADVAVVLDDLLTARHAV